MKNLTEEQTKLLERMLDEGSFRFVLVAHIVIRTAFWASCVWLVLSAAGWLRAHS